MLNFDALTAPQLLRWRILENLSESLRRPIVDDWTEADRELVSRFSSLSAPKQVDALYAWAESNEGLSCEFSDYVGEVRRGGIDTDVEAPSSRHYESKSKGAVIQSRWVGWTFWYGGGKHGTPDSMEWIDDAYFLECVEEQQVVTVRIFKKREEPNGNAHQGAKS